MSTTASISTTWTQDDISNASGKVANVRLRFVVHISV